MTAPDTAYAAIGRAVREQNAINDAPNWWQQHNRDRAENVQRMYQAVRDWLAEPHSAAAKARAAAAAERHDELRRARDQRVNGGAL